MKSQQPEAWKHHFVPRSLLKYFRPPGDDEYLYTFDKKTGKSYRTAIENAGSRNGFNSFKQGDLTVNFEQDFDAVDALLAKRLREIHDVASVASFSPTQRSDWDDLIAVQLVRTPIVRSTFTTFAADFSKQLREKFNTEFGGECPSENDARKAARANFLERQRLRKHLATKDVVLFEAPVGNPFQISDRPVVIQSSLPFGDGGLSSVGVAIHMPLGQRLMLGMYCPSIRYKLNTLPLDKLELPDEVAARLTALRQGLNTGALINVDSTIVEKHNQQQTIACMRFVYGPNNNFASARALVAAHPEIREVLSSIRMGEFGYGAGPRAQMPLGTWLTLVGRAGAHMLEVHNVICEAPFEVTVVSEAALAQAMRDAPFSEMKFYVDKYERSGMRNVKLIVIKRESGMSVQIRHSDAFLDGLMSRIR